MQNKANFRKSQMNLNFYSKKEYENEPASRFQKKQIQSKPISILKTRIDVYNYLVAAVKNCIDEAEVLKKARLSFVRFFTDVLIKA